MESKKIIHIALKDPQEGEKADYYFGSVPAVYSVFTRERLGLAQTTFGEYLRLRGGHENRHFKVTIGELVRNVRNKRNIDNQLNNLQPD